MVHLKQQIEAVLSQIWHNSCALCKLLSVKFCFLHLSQYCIKTSLFGDNWINTALNHQRKSSPCFYVFMSINSAYAINSKLEHKLQIQFIQFIQFIKPQVKWLYWIALHNPSVLQRDVPGVTKNIDIHPSNTCCEMKATWHSCVCLWKSHPRIPIQIYGNFYIICFTVWRNLFPIVLQ